MSSGWVRGDARTSLTEDTLLHQILEENDIENLLVAFQKSKKGLTEEELKDALKKVANISYNDQVFNVMFMKMNTTRDGFLTWDDFLSFLILGFTQAKIETGYVQLDDYISEPPRLIKSKHSYPLNRITYYPTVQPDRSVSYLDGSILTCSCDGTINYWSLDLIFERTVKSTSPVLKIKPTYVIDCLPLPDLSVICVSSTERDLRFYDTSARKFVLRVYLSYLSSMVTAMHYHFSKDPNEESKLVLGDNVGNIQILFITAVARGPFKSSLGQLLLETRWEQVVKGNVNGFRVVNYNNQHSDFVRQVAYYPPLKSIISCSNCPKVPFVMIDTMKEKPNYKYKILSNSNPTVWCFAVFEGVLQFVTGSPDTVIRLWNPFVPSHPIGKFEGHQTPIVALVLQAKATRLYSLSQDKCIKVWDISSQSCLQTYRRLPNEIGEYSDMKTWYNPKSRDFIIGSTMIAIVRCNPKRAGEHTDGITHSGPVSVVLYNTLFKIVVTCGLDSRIFVWNPWDGRRLMKVENAHTKLVHHIGVVPIEITAGTFDSALQRLITGAHNGTLKVWNFNTGICLRNIKLDQPQEIKTIIWVPKRILVMGCNKLVTEFADCAELSNEFFKSWEPIHEEDISSASVRSPQSLVTASYDGDLVFWQLETGQPYRRCNISNPTVKIKIIYKIQKKKHAPDVLKEMKKEIIDFRTAKPRTSIISVETKPSTVKTRGSLASFSGTLPRSKRMGRKISMVEMPEQCIPLRKLAIHCVLFLQTRAMEPEVGSLLVSLENGTIQVWSHHYNGGFIKSFQAAHKAGDYVVCMDTDSKNEYVFTGTSMGYIKTFLIINYCTGNPKSDAPIGLVQMMKYRLQFPFLWGEFLVGRAKRIARNQGKPELFNSHRAHIASIASIIFVEDAKILITAAGDGSARMWTLGGRYIQTIGTFKEWKPLEETGCPEDFPHTIPPDLSRVVSSTSFRILNGGDNPKRMTIKQLKQQADKQFMLIDSSKHYGHRLEEPILGSYIVPKTRPTKLDIKLDGIAHPVYQNLLILPPEDFGCEIDNKLYTL